MAERGKEMEKVIDIEERIPSMREKRRRRTNRKFIVMIAIFLFALLLILYFQSPYSRIDKIHIKGAELHDKHYYEQTSGLVAGELLWGFSAAKVAQQLERIDEVESVSISRKWLRDVEITINEWTTLAYIEKEGSYQALLENGSVFSEEFVTPNSKVPILTNFTTASARERIIKQLNAMDGDAYTLLSEVVYTGTKEDPTTITAYMDDGYEIHAVISTFAEKMVYYSDITAQLSEYEKGVIDFEVGTFFTPYSVLYGNIEDEEGEKDEEELEREP